MAVKSLIELRYFESVANLCKIPTQKDKVLASNKLFETKRLGSPFYSALQ